MRAGTRILVTQAVETPDGYELAPLREGYVMGHPSGDGSRVWIRWVWGREGLSLMRVSEAERWRTTVVHSWDPPHADACPLNRTKV